MICDYCDKDVPMYREFVCDRNPEHKLRICRACYDARRP